MRCIRCIRIYSAQKRFFRHSIGIVMQLCSKHRNVDDSYARCCIKSVYAVFMQITRIVTVFTSAQTAQNNVTITTHRCLINARARKRFSFFIFARYMLMQRMQ